MGKTRKLLCQGCGREHSAASLEDEQGFARCKDCNAIFVFPKDVVWSDAAAFRTDPPRAPKRVQTHEERGGVTIEWRYEHPRVGVLVAIVAALVGLIVLIGVMPTDTDADLRLLLQIPPACGAFFAGYFVLLSFIERIVVEVADGRLRVRGRPLALPRVSAQYDVKKIHDVFVDKALDVGGKRALLPFLRPTDAATQYDVTLCLDSGTATVVRLADLEHALHVAGALREALSIPVGPSKHLLDVMTRARVLTELLAKQIAAGASLTGKPT